MVEKDEKESYILHMERALHIRAVSDTQQQKASTEEKK